VNEGAVEWPPSPWRLLRAILAVWRHKCPDVPEDDMRRLLGSLMSAPWYRLPSASQGHSRHFMPGANDQKTKVFDTFVALDKSDPLIVVWPNASLEPAQQDQLGQVLSAMSYFGRAESWVSARLIPAWEGEFNAVPVDGLESFPADAEVVRVLGPIGDETYSSWRANTQKSHRQRKLEQMRATAVSKGKPVDKAKLSKKDEAMIEANLPENIFTALQVNTDELRAAGWSLPPGSQWINYAHPSNAFASKPRQQHLRPKQQLPTVARFAICGAVRPRLTEAVWIAERVRKLLMGCSEAVMPDKNATAVFSGKNPDGSPLRESHSHSHYLCEATRNDGRITHITVYAPGGFTNDDERALSRLRKVWGYGGHDLQLVLLGIGHPRDFGGVDEKAGQSRILAESKFWVSRTPFVLARHLKFSRQAKRDLELREKQRISGLEQAVRFELEQRPQFRELVGATRIVPRLATNQTGTDLGGHYTTWLKFRRDRQNGGGRAADSHGYGFLLEFPKPVSGPIALGYGCHFGLGQFIPAESVPTQ
jgi:CRISPR-associated protein Csb2